jgi:hypothetical protein
MAMKSSTAANTTPSAALTTTLGSQADRSAVFTRFTLRDRGRTWRQFRVQALVGVGALLLLAIYVVLLGKQIHSNYDDTLAQPRSAPRCRSPHS